MLRVLLFLLTVAVSLHANGVEWKHWDEGFAEAKRSGKPVLVDVVREGCHYCTDMEREVFEDAQMALFIHEHYVPVKVNLTYERMPSGHQVPMTPSFCFFTSEGAFIKMVPGSWNRKDFTDFLTGMQRQMPAAKPVEKGMNLNVGSMGYAVFEAKCAECHRAHVELDLLLENFAQSGNSLGLKGPTMNQLSFRLKQQIGDPDGDEEFHRMEVREFVRDYLIEPSLDKSLCLDDVLEYFEVMPSMAGKISDEEIDAVAEWIYDLDRKENQR